MVGIKLLCSMLQLFPKVSYVELEELIKSQRKSKAKFPSLKVRVFELKRDGVIKSPSRKIIFDNKKLNISILHCYVEVNSILKINIEETENFLSSIDEIRHCIKTLDDKYAFSLKISYTTPEHKELILRKLSENDNIKSLLVCDEISTKIEKANIPLVY